MRILITGGAGFIGSHLAEYCLEKGDDVWIIDDLSTGSVDNLTSFASHPRLRVESSDLLQYPHLKEALIWADQVYHMAAVVGQKIVIANPSYTLFQNIALCERVCAVARDLQNPPSIFIASSSEVYADTCQFPFSEEEPIVFPSDGHVQECYRLSKFVNEKTVLSYAHTTGKQCLIGRLFNTIGHRQRGRYGMVVPRFIRQACLQEAITVYGDGSQTRSFAYVKDTAEAIRELMGQENRQYHIVNIGNDAEISIRNLAELVASKAGYHSEIVYIPYQSAYGVDYVDCKRRRPDLRRLRSLLPLKSWNPLDSIIDLMLK